MEFLLWECCLLSEYPLTSDLTPNPPLPLALQVDSAWLSGDHDGARRHSNSARMWNIVGIIVGVVLYVLVVVAVVVANVVSANAAYTLTTELDSV